VDFLVFFTKIVESDISFPKVFNSLTSTDDSFLKQLLLINTAYTISFILIISNPGFRFLHISLSTACFQCLFFQNNSTTFTISSLSGRFKPRFFHFSPMFIPELRQTGQSAVTTDQINQQLDYLDNASSQNNC
jgi:hypothetical protein